MDLLKYDFDTLPNKRVNPTPFRYAVWKCFAFYFQTTPLQAAGYPVR